MKSATRGNVGEAAVLSAFTDRGLNVLTPFGSGHPYDLLVELASGRLLRVQVKTGWALGAEDFEMSAWTAARLEAVADQRAAVAA